ncbi:MAG TPA: hypothetical protein VGK67_11325 [Myxococcales bacterium]|jgi:hypothetical protein
MASRRERNKKAQAAPAAPANPLLAPAIATAALLVVAAFEGGPLGFLPHLLRWPLVAAGALPFWLPHLDRRGLKWPAWAPAAAEACCLVLVFGTYLLFKTVGIHGSDTDENIYFYMAQRLAQGAVPYRDFFFAHPPVHLLVPALVFKVVGFSLPLAKLVAPSAQVVAAACLYLAIRKASRPMAVLAVLFHLTAYEVLMGSSDMDGENILTAFLGLAVLFAVRGRPLAAGIAAGLALGTGMYALAGALALMVAFAGTSWRATAWYAAGLVGCVALWNGVFGALGGQGFVDGVYRYHFAKAASGDHISLFASANPITFVSAYLHDLGVFLGGRVFGKSVFWHTSLYVAFALGTALAVGPALAQPAGTGPLRKGFRRLLASMLSGTPQGLALLGALAGLLYLLQWAALNEVYDFYLVPQMALMALPAGWALVRIVELGRGAADPRGLALAGALAAVFCLHTGLSHAIHDDLWPEELRDRGQVASYTWRDPIALTGPAQLARALFFKDQRLKGEPNPPYRHYIWNKALAFSTAPELAAYVAANTAPDETISGASTTTPLVALLAGRRVAGDEADTNNKRFRSGMLSDRAYWDEVCSDKIKFILAFPRSRFTVEYMDRDPTARRFFERDRTFQDPLLKHFRSETLQLFRRRDGVGGLPDGRVCALVE